MLNYSLLLVVILVVFATSDAALPPTAHMLHRSTTLNQVQTVESPVNGKQAVQLNNGTSDSTFEERAATCLSSLNEWVTAGLRKGHGWMARLGKVTGWQKAKAFWKKVRAAWKMAGGATLGKMRAAWIEEEEADLEQWGAAPKRSEEGGDLEKSEAALGRKQEGAILDTAAAASVEEERPFGWSKAGRWWENDVWEKNGADWGEKPPTAEELAEWDRDFEQMKKDGVTLEEYKQRLFDNGEMHKLIFEFYEDGAWKNLDWWFFGRGYAKYRRYLQHVAVTGSRLRTA